MPTYEFFCEECECHHELTQSITADLPSQCPECESPTYRQIYSGGVFASCKQSPTEVGQQAELNQKVIGRTKMQEEAGVIQDKKEARRKRILNELNLPTTDELPFWRRALDNPEKPLDVSKIKDVNKYIETGVSK